MLLSVCTDEIVAPSNKVKMPIFADDEIKAFISDGTIAGITLDTSIFDRYGCNLAFPLLTTLAQFKGGAVRVVFSDVVLGEVKRHIAEEADNSHVKLRAALRAQQNRWKIDLRISDFLSESTGGRASQQAASDQVDSFLNVVGGHIVQSAEAPGTLEAVLGRYFGKEPPFEKSGAKKSEFPDAFALVSLERAFPSRRRMLLCVSADKGWQAFAEKSDSIIVVNKLDTALSFFNEAGRHVVDRIIHILSSGDAPALIREIQLSIQARIDDMDFSPECSSSIDYEAEPGSAALQVVHFDDITEVSIVASDADAVTFTFKIDATVEFEAHFNFQAYDSIDKDYVSLSSEYAGITVSKTIKMVIAVQRVLEPEPVAVKVEAFLPRYYSVDFGYVEPFPDDDPTHEKY